MADANTLAAPQTTAFELKVTPRSRTCHVALGEPSCLTDSLHIHSMAISDGSFRWTVRR